MGPESRVQIKWGLAVCALALVLVLAFVPDPFFRTRAIATTLDNVEGIDRGTPVAFRGVVVGEVRSVELDPASRDFRVRLDVRRDWRPSACSFVSASAANPFTPSRIELVAIEPGEAAAPAQCEAAMAAQACAPVPLLQRGEGALAACRRAPDLVTSATLAVADAASVARSANAMTQRLQGMLGNGGAGGADMAHIATNATATLAALTSLSGRLDRSFTPGRGDLALTLGNVRQMTGKLATVDVGAVNGLLGNTNGVVTDNRAHVAVLVDQAAKSAAQANQTLEGASASLVEATANLNAMTANLNALTERLAADPTYAVRGRHYADPPGLEPKK